MQAEKATLLAPYEISFQLPVGDFKISVHTSLPPLGCGGEKRRRYVFRVLCAMAANGGCACGGKGRWDVSANKAASESRRRGFPRAGG